MKIMSINNTNMYKTVENSKSAPKHISFQGKVVNGHYYTDQEYVDAINFKHLGTVTCCNFVERYGTWEYIFTSKAEKHAAEVNKCIADIKAEEYRAAKEKEIRLKAQEEEKQRLEKELTKIKQKNMERQKIIELYTQLDKTDNNLYNLRQEQKDLIIDEFIQPLAENIADGNSFVNIPNAILVLGIDDSQNDSIIKALGKQILKDKMLENFIEVKYDGNLDHFQSLLLKTKQTAQDKYLKNKELSIIYLQNFDAIAVKRNNPKYNPILNSFLKTFILDCAENGIFVFATATDEDKIETPFLVNNRRFGVKINLEDED